MKKYNVLQAIILSFFSRSLYRDIAKNWGISAFFYLLLITAISWLFYIYPFQQGINKFFTEGTNTIVPQIPVLTIKNGVLSTPENHPYIIVDPKTNERIAIIDTTGEYSNLQQTNAKILITQTQVIMSPQPDETRINKIPQHLNAVIEPTKVHEWLKSFASFIWIFTFPFLIILSFIYRLIQALIYGIIGLLFNSLFRSGLTYGKILKIEMVAITPAIALATVLPFVNSTYTHWGLICFVLAMIYLAFGISSNKNTTPL